MDKPKIFTLIFIFIIFGILAFIIKAGNNKVVIKKVLDKKQTKVNTTILDLTLFYGNACPHCADLEKWMQENKIEEKIKIIKKEVYDNQQNAQELTQAAKKCGLTTNSIGVPFLFAEGRCLIGTSDIISFLSQKAGN
jgi:glutaredoxin